MKEKNTVLDDIADEIEVLEKERKSEVSEEEKYEQIEDWWK